MTERVTTGGLADGLGAFPADAAAPGHDNLYDEDVLTEVATEISDLAFANNVPRRVIRIRGTDSGEETDDAGLASGEAGKGGNADEPSGDGTASSLLDHITKRLKG